MNKPKLVRDKVNFSDLFGVTDPKRANKLMSQVKGKCVALFNKPKPEEKERIKAGNYLIDNLIQPSLDLAQSQEEVYFVIFFMGQVIGSISNINEQFFKEMIEAFVEANTKDRFTPTQILKGD